jgi:hypothetical protein
VLNKILSLDSTFYRHVVLTTNMRVMYIVWELDDRGSRVRFPVGAGNFSLHHRVKNGSGAHPASYPMGTRGSFPGGTTARA